MTGGNTSEHLSVAMTTESADDVTQTTAAGVPTPPSTLGTEYYFQCVVLVIGIVGTAANALILYALVVSKQHKKQMLIFNQNVVDFCSCLSLIIIRAARLSRIRLSGKAGYWFCMLIMGEAFLWVLTLTSKANIMLITAERYLKIVYATWSKNHLRTWMLWVAIAFAWFSGTLYTSLNAFLTGNFVNGVCYANAYWTSRVAYMIQAFWNILFYYVLMLIVFIFGYWRILLVLRRQARAVGGSNSSQSQSNQMQSNVMKTMILVSALYAICEFSINCLHLLVISGANVTISYDTYLVAQFLSFFYFCANPFIYAVKFDPVKRVLLDLVRRKKPAVNPVAVNTGNRGGTAATGTTRLAQTQQ